VRAPRGQMLAEFCAANPWLGNPIKSKCPKSRMSATLKYCSDSWKATTEWRGLDGPAPCDVPKVAG
jgi:hypothetical protein